MVRIARLTQPRQFAQSIPVQRSAWGQEASSTIPTHLLIAAQNHGGLVLGAFDGERMVGILFGITAIDQGRPYHYSHITGVSRKYQGRGIGFLLKMAQRKHVIEKGQDLVKWTYDPLQAGNAYFNINKLGSTCGTYHRNLYGRLDDYLNRERITDRFEVEWRVKSARVKHRISGAHKPQSPAEFLAEGAEPVNVTKKTGREIRLPVSSRLKLRGSMLLVEIPRNIVKVREASLKASNAWTLHVRRIFENYFRKAYEVTDVTIDKDEDRVFYLLERQSKH